MLGTWHREESMQKDFVKESRRWVSDYQPTD